MDEDVNTTYITLGGHVDIDKYRYLYFVIVCILYAFIIISNSTIVYIIWSHQNLHQPMYIFIAALLINSVLLSTVIYPKLLVDLLSEEQIISYPACLLQYFLSYSLGGSEMLLLLAMAYDRYVSVCKPLQYPTIMKKTAVCVLLALAWILPACEFVVTLIMSFNRKLCSFTLTAIFCNNSINTLHCVTSRSISIYGVFLLLNVIYLPMLFILYTYAKIFQITFGSSREVRTKAAETCLPHLLVLVNFSLLITFEVIIVRLESNIPQLARVIMSLQLVLCHPLLNPIIYGLKMKEISKYLRKLLC